MVAASVRLSATAPCAQSKGAADCRAVARRRLRSASHPLSRQLLLCAQTNADLDRLRPLQQQQWPGESFVVCQHAAYIGCADSMIDSPIAKAVAKRIGDAGTTRNAATMGKLVQMLEVREG